MRVAVGAGSTLVERVATEHFAFCPDQHDPQNGTVYTPRTYAETIRGARLWKFWWD